LFNQNIEKSLGKAICSLKTVYLILNKKDGIKKFDKKQQTKTPASGCWMCDQFFSDSKLVAEQKIGSVFSTFF
jgi:hypothetical protein